MPNESVRESVPTLQHIVPFRMRTAYTLTAQLSRSCIGMSTYIGSYEHAKRQTHGGAQRKSHDTGTSIKQKKKSFGNNVHNCRTRERHCYRVSLTSARLGNVVILFCLILASKTVFLCFLQIRFPQKLSVILVASPYIIVSFILYFLSTPPA